MASRPTPAELAGRPTYTRAQLEQYFDLISLPHAQRRYSLSTEDGRANETANGHGSGNDVTGEKDLAYLTLLMKHQIVRVPFENLTLHYSWHRVIDPSPVRMFKKIVGASAPSPLPQSGGHHHTTTDNNEVRTGGGQGGYCMEVNSFFHTVLLSIGFDAYMAGARVWSPVDKKYTGFSHCVNIVTIGGVRYLVDVGFGPNAAVRPLRIEADTPSESGDGGGVEGVRGVGAAYDHIGPARMRLRRDTIAQGVSRARGHNLGWIYQVKYDSDTPGPSDGTNGTHGEQKSVGDDEDGDDKWTTQYMFVDTEFTLEDIAVCNMYPGTNKKSFFTYTVLCVRFTTDKEEAGGGEEKGPLFPGRCSTSALVGGEIDGALILWGDSFKWRRGGKVVLERKIEGDRDRLDILEKYFGIAFDEEDVQAIKGTAGALGGL